MTRLSTGTHSSTGSLFRRHAPREIGCVEHIALSRATFTQAPTRLRERGIDFIQRDRASLV